MCGMSIDKHRGSEATLLKQAKTVKNRTFPSFFTPSRDGQKEIMWPSDQATSPGVTQMRFNTQLGNVRLCGCVYCDGTDHRPHECNKVFNPDERQKIFLKNMIVLQLCWRRSQGDGMEEQKNVFVLQKNSPHFHLWQRKHRHLNDRCHNMDIIDCLLTLMWFMWHLIIVWLALLLYLVL